MELNNDYNNNTKLLKDSLGFGKTFDVLSREIILGTKKVCFLFIDGFVKDESLQALINTLSLYKGDNVSSAQDLQTIVDTCITAIEVSIEKDTNEIIKAILSGQTCMIVDGFNQVIMLDLRTYPARSPDEPDIEKVLRGSRDGFVETIVFNTALIRRRIRDPKLRFEMMTIGSESKTDVAIAYIEGKCKEKALKLIRQHLSEINTQALTLGGQSLIECLSKKSWYNPLPKVRFSERPDITAAHILEGNIIVLVDNNPSAMLMPISIFDFLQDVDDYYSPIITGNYLRFVRNIVLLVTLFLTPVYMLIVDKGTSIPEWMQFLLPSDPYNISILWQFLILEVAIDGLRQASLNTPGSLGMSLSVIGALILGEFTVSTGWFIPQTILYMAIVALATFIQQSIELGYAVKFFRIFLLLTTYFFKGYGLIIGTIICFIVTATTKTFTGEPYLYPLIPFNFKALCHVLFRTSIK